MIKCCTLLTSCTTCTNIKKEVINEMVAIHSSEVRKDWSSIMDSVIRRKPAFIIRNRDVMMLSSVEQMQDLLSMGMI